jgi:Flp pilus assembly protein TadG
MSPFAELFRRFRKDERGVFLVIFAVLGLVLIATSGAVVDFSRVQQARTRAQTALDAAALALQEQVGKTGVTAATLKTQAQALLTERMNDNSVTATIEAATPDVASGKLTITAFISVNTFFAQLVGINSIRANLLSEVQRSSSDLEVSLALDVTGSMLPSGCDWWGNNCTKDKIGDLIDATNTLIDLLVSDTQTPTYSKMAIVPWSSGVNVGTTYATNVRGTPNTTTKNITAASWSSGTS